MQKLKSLLRSIGLDREDGQILPLFAFAIVALIAMTGVVVDGGNLFQNRQSLQNAADAAAVAAALYIVDGTKSCQGSASVGGCAGIYAGLNGVKGQNGNIVASLLPCDNTVTDTRAPANPPGCYVYPYNGAGQVEVWLTQRTANFFGGILGIDTSTESARAIGTVGAGTPPPITFAALDNSCDNHTLLIKLGGKLVVKSGIYVNSCNDHDGFDVFGGGSLSSPKIQTVGGWETHNSSTVYVPAAPLVCTFPRNSGVTDWKITTGPPPSYGSTPTGCPDIGQPLLIDPFAGFPPAPTLGAGNVGTPVSITKVSRGLNGDAANVARVVTASPHGLTVGGSVSISGVGTFGGGNFDGSYTVASVPNATTFTYADTGSNVPVITQKQLSGGVATLTTNAPTTLTVGENDLSVAGIPGFSINNPPGAAVLGIGATSFSYQPPPFTLGITKKQLQSGTATLTTGSTAGLDPGDTVTIAGVGSPFDGSQTVAAVTGTTFTFANSATTTLAVTQKAAAHGVATLTAVNKLSPGDTVTVNIGDPRFDGTYTVAANPAPSGTKFSYVDSNLGTMTISPTTKVMAAGVATITVANNLANGENVTLNLGDVNYDGGPYSVSGVSGTIFKYTPAVPVSLTTGSISNGLATVHTSVNHKLSSLDDVKVSGDEAYGFAGNASNVGVPNPPTTFNFTPAPIAIVSWNVTSPTSATFSTSGPHDTNITNITIAGSGKGYLNKTWPNASGGALTTVTANGFTITGTGFTTGDHGAAGTVTVNTAGSTTFSGALATSETAWNLASKAASGTVTVPYFLATTGASGTVTAPAFVAATAVSPVGSATVTDVPLLPASGTFTPAWMPTFGVIAKNLSGSAGIPSPDVITTGTVTLQPGTYYGGICIGVAAGSNCSTGANCTAAGGSTAVAQSYSPVVTLAAALTGDGNSPNYNTVIVNPPGPIAKDDLIAIDDEEMIVTAILGNTLTVTRAADGTEEAAHTSGTQVFHVVTQPNGTPFAPAKKLGAAIANTTVTSITVNSTNPNPIGVGDVIQIGSEAMTVTAVPSGTLLTVTRGALGTTPAAHANGLAVLKVFDASAPPPPSVTLTKGVYIMAGGGFSVCGAGDVNAPNGVMIYNTNDPGFPTGNGALGQVNINTSGSVHLHPMTDGIYAGLTIFQDRNLTLVPGSACGGKGSDTKASQWDIALQSAAPLFLSGELGSISGTIYAPHLRADFGDTMSGIGNLAVITSCIYINGANSTFNFNPGGGQLFGAGATLGG